MPNAYVPPATDGRTKLNLILGSANQRLDVFQGNWGDYKEVALPINDLLDEYGPNVKRAFSAEQWAGVTDSEGRIRGIPRLGVMGHIHPTWFNDQMLRDLGLPQPQTLEEAVATFEKIRESIPDAIILIGRLRDLRMALVGGFTEYGYSKWPDEQGSLPACCSAPVEPDPVSVHRLFTNSETGNAAARVPARLPRLRGRHGGLVRQGLHLPRVVHPARQRRGDEDRQDRRTTSTWPTYIAAVKDAVSAYDDIERMIDDRDSPPFITWHAPVERVRTTSSPATEEDRHRQAVRRVHHDNTGRSRVCSWYLRSQRHDHSKTAAAATTAPRLLPVPVSAGPPVREPA